MVEPSGPMIAVLAAGPSMRAPGAPGPTMMASLRKPALAVEATKRTATRV